MTAMTTITRNHGDLRFLCDQRFSPCLRASVVKIAFPMTAMTCDHGDLRLLCFKSFLRVSAVKIAFPSPPLCSKVFSVSPCLRG